MKKYLLLTLVSLILTSSQGAEPGGSLYLKPKDVDHVEIELEYDSNPQLRVYFTSAKLSETQTVVENNLNKPISIFMNDTLIVAPTLKEPLKSKIRYLTLTFTDFETTAQVARGFVPAN
ncbi:hypothetical protein EI77_04200 [Prosthecobacter fusiformis]|uniref:Uncharacterized protein n=1 Tax=Prosthecobacter fusiformis TaxID=48464 RepID=A0A4R7RL73_9BACT|nr:hypothetical protein [Prosthecobacter fusiformis]TDU64312.1 hypothetical protein EI77_04200 [Prosthecobacter fusiformis]